MKQFTMIFTTRHRNGDAVENDCNLICSCINEFTTRYKLLYNGKELIVFHVYDTDKEDRHKILISIVGSLHCDDSFKSLDLQSYTNQ